MDIRPFLLLPVTDIQTAKAYIDALVANNCDFHFDDDLKTIYPFTGSTLSGTPLFNHDEQLIVADRIESLRDHMADPFAYMLIALARRHWTAQGATEVMHQFELFGQSPQTRSEELSDADMVALLEAFDPNGDYEELSSGMLMELMNYFGNDL